MELGELPDQPFPSRGWLSGVKLSQFWPSVQDAMAIHQKVAGRGLRGGPRSGIHPAEGLGALAPADLAFFRFK
jgi:hypothetical protein